MNLPSIGPLPAFVLHVAATGVLIGIMTGFARSAITARHPPPGLTRREHKEYRSLYAFAVGGSVVAALILLAAVWL